ncbi:MAG: hypothetical protein MRJ68_17535 [Nitrospira sp.]|nr:hypothetical protein [Nitrospira sp.]
MKTEQQLKRMKSEMQVRSFVPVQYGQFTATQSTLWWHAGERMVCLEMKGFRTTSRNGVEEQVRDSLIRECSEAEVKAWLEQHVTRRFGEADDED